MTKEEQAHVDTAYSLIRSAMDELLSVKNKDKGLIQVQGALYRMEDILYQYRTKEE